MATGFIEWTTQEDQRTVWDKILLRKPKIKTRRFVGCYLNGIFFEVK